MSSNEGSLGSIATLLHTLYGRTHPEAD